MFHFLIALRNLVILVVLAWLGIDASDDRKDTDKEAPSSAMSQIIRLVGV